MVTSLVLALALSASPAANEVRIDRFRSGLACTRSTRVAGGPGWICQPTELILVTDQGRCVYDQKDKLCTWVGFEFDYLSSTPGTKLQCETTSSVPGNEGNYQGVRAVDTTSSTWELELPGLSGHIFHPQYFVLNVQAADEEDLIYQTACRHQGKELFRARFKVHFPVVGDK